MIKINKDWYERLQVEFEKPYFKKLQRFLKDEYMKFNIFPSENNVFNALNYLPYEKVKIVILGQDPYHEEGQAMGLSFSVPDNMKIPPSLVNIYKEIESDLNIKCEKNGNLIRWAAQGVLLLNTVLTVRQGQANSHKGQGWEILTTEIIKQLSSRTEPMVFLLWGANAKSFKPLISPHHLILDSVHPSPLSAYGGFFGCKHFSKANNFLLNQGKTPIDWK